MGAIHDGMSVRRAAEEYGIPRSTLYDHYSGKIAQGSRSGPKRYLDSTEEAELAQFLTDSSLIGYSRTPKQVVELVQNVVDKKGMNVKVSNSWWKSFRSRHTDSTVRTAEVLTYLRLKGSSDQIIGNYFNLLETTISHHKLADLPCQIFNLDESGFPLSPKPRDKKR